MKKLLIIGASGLVGKALATACEHDFDVYGTYFSSATNLAEDKQFQVDIQDGEALRNLLNTIEPDLVVSTLGGNLEQQLTFHQLLASELENRNSLLYFISTTNVFDGDLSRHHNESDKTTSISDYGQYKIHCEKMLQEVLGDRAILIRIPGIWGKDSPRFTMLLQKLESGEPIEAYKNLECSYLTDVHLAKQLHYMLKNDVRGIMHLCAEDKILDAQFYEQLIKQLTSIEIKLQLNHIHDPEKVYLFGLDSIRTDLPNTLSIKNSEVIDFLAGTTATQI